MKALYVLSAHAEDSASPMDELAALEPALEVHTATGAAAALAEIRTSDEYRAVFLSPQLPPNEALALVATLRRDRAPIAIVAIITEAQRQFFGQAITAGADDVLVLGEAGLITAEETLRRVRRSHHLDRPDGQPPLRVIYVGQDDLALDLLFDMPFVTTERATAAADGVCPLTLSNDGEENADVIVVDEQPGDGHALQVVKWVKAHAPDLPLVVLTSPTGHDVAGAALDLGADDVVSKAGTYRRRLIATLHRYYLRRLTTGTTGTRNELTQSSVLGSGPDETEQDALEEPARHVEPVVPASNGEAEETAQLTAAVASESRIRDLTAEVAALSGTLDAQRQACDELREVQGFERAMRDRDREELARLRQAFAEERERRIVLEDTLRRTEDQATAEAEALEARHAEARRDLEAQLTVAADRLHQVANETQGLQTHLQNELTAQAAVRDRLVENHLFGHATVTLDGALVRCNTAFARMFGFDSAADATAGPAAVFEGLADHAHVVLQLQAGVNLNRVESVVRRANGTPFHVLTSAAFLPSGDDRPQMIERVLIDVDDRTHVEEQLRLARRLEAAGRLAAEMSAEIDPVLSSIDDASAPASERQHLSTLVRQLLAFSRRQAKPAGLLSLYDAIRRAEPLLRQIAGDGFTFELRIEDMGAIAASEDDIEQLLAALVFAAADSLPYSGTIALDTRSVRSGFDQFTELAVSASGYGVRTALLSASLARLVTKCGGTVHVTDNPARATTLHVHLPC